MAGETHSTLQLTNLQWSDAGIYQVLVTNKYGSLPSSNATLGIGPLAFWGPYQNYIFDFNPPLDLTNVSRVVSSGSYCLALKPDGTLAGWGIGGPGIIAGAAGLTNVSSIATGSGHALALLADQGVVAWGANNFGQTNVPRNLTNTVAIAAGANCSMALSSDGSVSVWGGDTFSSGLTNVPWGLKAVAVGAGQSHCVALTAKGTVIAWGNNNYGQTAVPAGTEQCRCFGGRAAPHDGFKGRWHSRDVGLHEPRADERSSAGHGPRWDCRGPGFRPGSPPRWLGNRLGQRPFHPSPTNVPPGLFHAFSVAAGGPCAFALRNSGEPYISVQPATQMAWADAPVTLFSLAAGAEPLSCQWQLDGVDISGATNSTLTLDSAAFEDSGRYTVQYSNELGVVTSTAALLSVRPQLTVATWGTPGGSYAPAAMGLSNLVAISGDFALSGAMVPISSLDHELQFAPRGRQG